MPATESPTRPARPKLEAAIAELNATLHRMPEHWVERRAVLHAKINALLADWERA